MIPNIFANYFLASAGAGGALIGLLFVAVSIRPDYTVGSAAHPARRGVASGAFTALTNAFFVSLAALIPLTNVGAVIVLVSAVDVVVTLFLVSDLVQRTTRAPRTSVHWRKTARVGATLAISFVLYAYECVIGVGLMTHPGDVGYALSLANLLLGVYAVGLARAWELLGGFGGIIARMLNPLQDIEDTPPPPPATTPLERVSAERAPADGRPSDA